MASGEPCAPDGDIARRQQKDDRKREERGSGRPRQSLVPTRERRVGLDRTRVRPFCKRIGRLDRLRAAVLLHCFLFDHYGSQACPSGVSFVGVEGSKPMVWHTQPAKSTFSCSDVRTYGWFINVFKSPRSFGFLFKHRSTRSLNSGEKTPAGTEGGASLTM